MEAPTPTVQEVLARREQCRHAIKTAMDAQAAACQALQSVVDTCNAYIIAGLPEMNDEQLMALRFDAVEAAAVIAGKHKAELDAYSTEESACSARIKQIMLDRGLQQLKVASGHETHFTTKDSVTVQDMDKVVGFMLHAAPCHPAVQPGVWGDILTHIQSTGMWGLLTKAIQKTNTREILQGGVAPDDLGVKFTSFKDLVWSRGKAKE